MKILKTFAKTSKTTYEKKTNNQTEEMEVAFAQARELSEVTCNHCGKKGHFAKTCPERDDKKGQLHT